MMSQGNVQLAMPTTIHSEAEVVHGSRDVPYHFYWIFTSENDRCGSQNNPTSAAIRVPVSRTPTFVW